MTIKRFFLVILVGLFAACGFVPIQKEMLRTGETLAVDIEGYAFYEKLIITELGDGKTNFGIDRSSPLRNDEFAKEVGKIFVEKFPAELRARGVVVASGAPMKMKVHLAYGTTEKSPGVMALMAMMSFGQFEINVLSAFPLLVKKESIPFGEWRDLASAKVLAERLSELSANGVITQLREKSEIKSEREVPEDARLLSVESIDFYQTAALFTQGGEKIEIGEKIEGKNSLSSFPRQGETISSPRMSAKPF